MVQSAVVLRRIELLHERLLALFLRVAPSEQGRLHVLTVAIGLACGLTAVAFHLSIHSAEHLLIERALESGGLASIAGVIVTPAVGGLVAGVLLHYFLPAARGSGIPQVKVVYAVKSGRLRLRDTLGKFLVSTIQIGTGSSLGREGPTVQICAGVASTLGRAFAISPANLRRLIPVGAAAGIAAAFNAPIAAVTFTIEEIVGDLDQTVLTGVVIASAVAAVVERSILGEHPVFILRSRYALLHASSLVVYAALGVAAGFASHLFARSLLGVRAWSRELRAVPPWARPAIGGLVTGALAAAVFSTIGASGVTGGGYVTLSEALQGNVPLLAMAVLFGAKLLATVFSYSTGGAGGIFAPTLFVGAMLGGLFGHADAWSLGHELQTGAFALVGMGALFAGVIRAPITSVLIIFEMTGSYGLVLPLMIANATAYLIARHLEHTPIYEALLAQDGIELPHGPRIAAALSALTVRDAMTSKDLVTLPADGTLAESAARIAGLRFSTYPVLDADGRLAGVVSEARIKRKIAEGLEQSPLREILRPREHLTADRPITDAVVLMNRLGVRQLVVVADDDAGALVGMLAMSDVMRAHARATERSSGRRASEAPQHDPATTQEGLRL